MGVALVDDCEAESLELHAVFDDRMGADEDVDGAVEQGLEDFAAAFPLDGSCEEFYAEGHVAQEVQEGFEVLFCEDFGGCHDDGLVAVVDGDEGAEQGYEGFA